MEISNTDKRQRNFRRILFLVMAAVLSAMSAGLYFLDFPLPMFLSFLKIDFSDIPAVIGAFAMGPAVGITIELIKNLIHLPSSTTLFVGELANFVVGAMFVLPAALIYRRRRNSAAAVVGLAAGTLSMTAAGVLMNYFVTLPFFMTLFHMTDEMLFGMANALIPFAEINSLLQVVLLCVTPFNLFKCVMISLVSFLLHKSLGKFLKQ